MLPTSGFLVWEAVGKGAGFDDVVAAEDDPVNDV
jgi:hypothetical protein